MEQRLIDLLKMPESRIALTKELRKCNAPKWAIERVLETDMAHVGIVNKEDAELFVMAAAITNANLEDYCVMVIPSGNFAVIIGRIDDEGFRDFIKELNS